MAGDAEVLAALVRALEAPAGNSRLDVEALQKFIRDTVNPPSGLRMTPSGASRENVAGMTETRPLGGFLKSGA